MRSVLSSLASMLRVDTSSPDASRADPANFTYAFSPVHRLRRDSVASSAGAHLLQQPVDLWAEPLEPLEPNHAVAFLWSMLHPDEEMPAASSEGSPSRRAARYQTTGLQSLQQLAGLLAYHPLALVLAAAYIKKQAIKAEAFHSLYMTVYAQLLSDEKLRSDDAADVGNVEHILTVCASLSYQIFDAETGKRQGMAEHLAQMLLRRLMFFSGAQIPIDLVEQLVAQKYKPRAGEDAEYPVRLHRLVQHVLQRLSELFLLAQDDAGNYYMHPLLQPALQRRYEATRLTRALQNTLNWFDGVFDAGMLDGWSLHDVLAHAETLHAAAQQHLGAGVAESGAGAGAGAGGDGAGTGLDLVPATASTVFLPHCMADLLLQAEQYAEALPWWRQLEKELSRPDQQDELLQARLNIATCLRENREYAAAESHLNETLLLSGLSPQQRDTVRAYLAEVKILTAEDDEAAEAAQSFLSERTTAVFAGAAALAAQCERLAQAHHRAGNEQMAWQVLNLLSLLQGEDHPDVARLATEWSTMPPPPEETPPASTRTSPVPHGQLTVVIEGGDGEESNAAAAGSEDEPADERDPWQFGVEAVSPLVRQAGPQHSPIAAAAAASSEPVPAAAASAAPSLLPALDGLPPLQIPPLKPGASFGPAQLPSALSESAAPFSPLVARAGSTTAGSTQSKTPTAAAKYKAPGRVANDATTYEAHLVGLMDGSDDEEEGGSSRLAEDAGGDDIEALIGGLFGAARASGQVPAVISPRPGPEKTPRRESNFGGPELGGGGAPRRARLPSVSSYGSDPSASSSIPSTSVSSGDGGFSSLSSLGGGASSLFGGFGGRPALGRVYKPKRRNDDSPRAEGSLGPATKPPLGQSWAGRRPPFAGGRPPTGGSRMRVSAFAVAAANSFGKGGGSGGGRRARPGSAATRAAEDLMELLDDAADGSALKPTR